MIVCVDTVLLRCVSSDMGPRPTGSNWSHEYSSDVFVYDTQKGIFGRALGTSSHDPGLIPEGCGAFPINNNLPQVSLLNYLSDADKD